MPSDVFAVVLQVTEVLERLAVPYAIGGSMASSTHGYVRTTLDVDLIAALRASDIDSFVEALDQDFYADTAMIRTAVADQGSFNLIHLATSFKVDIFVVGGRAFDRRQLERRRLLALDPPAGKAFVASAEDVILAKLDWYRQGGEQSERQWNDILGVLEFQETRLDHEYLRRWAQDLNVADLLDRALTESQTKR